MYTHLSYAELPLCMYADHSNHGHLQPLIERPIVLKIVGTEIHTLQWSAPIVLFLKVARILKQSRVLIKLFLFWVGKGWSGPIPCPPSDPDRSRYPVRHLVYRHAREQSGGNGSPAPEAKLRARDAALILSLRTRHRPVWMRARGFGNEILCSTGPDFGSLTCGPGATCQWPHTTSGDLIPRFWAWLRSGSRSPSPWRWVGAWPPTPRGSDVALRQGSLVRSTHGWYAEIDRFRAYRLWLCGTRKLKHFFILFSIISSNWNI